MMLDIATETRILLFVLVAWGWTTRVAAGKDALPYEIELTTASTGYDGQTCWSVWQ